MKGMAPLNFQLINIFAHSIQELFLLPKTNLYNDNGLITNPNSIKELLLYLEIPHTGDKSVSILI